MGGNTLLQQRRGKGKPAYKIPNHFTKYELKFRYLDEIEMNKKLKGVIVDIIKDKIHYAPIMIVKYEDGSIVYLPAVEGVYVGKEVYCGVEAPIEVGNVLPLKAIPEGTQICMVEINPGDGGKIARASGTSAILVQKTEKEAIIKLPSGKTKSVSLNCRALIGVVAGGGRTDKPFVKAGIKYYYVKSHHKYWPVSAAVARNIADHPFGGKHRRNKGGITPLPKHGYPIKYGHFGSRKTGRGKKGIVRGTKKE
ncbi:MAG: 50S ribosomal protein L2 [Nanopusillaceae archaeon]